METDQLRRALKEDPFLNAQCGGVLAADQLPEERVWNLPKLYIVNTDVMNQPGQHWALMYLPRVGPAEFFDSMGKTPSCYNNNFQTWLSYHPEGYIYNCITLQDKNSEACGYYCLAYGLLRCRNMSMAKFLAMFTTNCKQNDFKVIEFVKQHLNLRHL